MVALRLKFFLCVYMSVHIFSSSFTKEPLMTEILERGVLTISFGGWISLVKMQKIKKAKGHGKLAVCGELLTRVS